MVEECAIQPSSPLSYGRGSDLAPNFVLAAGALTTINQADIDNGSTLVIEGSILDDSFGSRHVRQEIKLNNPNHVSAVQTDALGKFVIISFTVTDFAGNATVIHLRYDVSDTSILIADIGQKYLPTIQPSVTPQALLTST